MTDIDKTIDVLKEMKDGLDALAGIANIKGKKEFRMEVQALQHAISPLTTYKSIKAENERLKQGKCEHVGKNILSGDCKLCELAVAEEGYRVWVKKAKGLEKELSDLKAKMQSVKLVPEEKDCAYNKKWQGTYGKDCENIGFNRCRQEVALRAVALGERLEGITEKIIEEKVESKLSKEPHEAHTSEFNFYYGGLAETIAQAIRKEMG